MGGGGCETGEQTSEIAEPAGPDGNLRAFLTVTALSVVVAVVASFRYSEGRTVEDWDSLAASTQMKVHLLMGFTFLVLAPIAISLLFCILPIRALGFHDRSQPGAFLLFAFVGAVAGMIVVGNLQHKVGATLVGDEEVAASETSADKNERINAVDSDERPGEESSPQPTQTVDLPSSEKAAMLDGYFSTTEYGPLLLEMGFTGANATEFVESVCGQFDSGATAEEIRLRFVGGFADELHKAEAIIAFYAAGVPLYCPEHLPTLQAS